MATPDEVLERIDQLAMEFHGVNQRRFIEVLRKLKRTFFIGNLSLQQPRLLAGIGSAAGPGVPGLVREQADRQARSDGSRSAAAEPAECSRRSRESGLPARRPRA